MNTWPSPALWVNLTSGDITTVDVPEEFARMYLGGRGFNSRRLFDMVKPGVDGLSPDNYLIIGIGPLCGTLVPSSARLTISARSPLTGILGDSNIGGHFAPELRYAGYSQIIITGRSNAPVYLWIDDDRVQLRDARYLWGMDTIETQDAILEELGDNTVQILCIGPAGENLVRFACVRHGISSAAGRTGMGAVFGSKNLKAIVTRGTRDVEIAYPQEFEQVCKTVFEDIKAGERPNWTTPYLLEIASFWGRWEAVWKYRGRDDAAKAWSFGGEGIANVGGERYLKDFNEKKRACFSCPVHCKTCYEVKSGKFAGLRGEGFEYGVQIIAPWLDIREIEPVMQIHNLLNRYGIDSLTYAYMAQWIMQCYVNNLITLEDTNGLDLSWGNADSAIELVHLIGKREGIGKILAEGERRAPLLMGRGSERYEKGVKGMGSGDLPRMRGGDIVQYLTSTRGGDHLRAMFSPGSVPMPVVKKRFPNLVNGFNEYADRLEGFGCGLKYFEDLSAIVNSLGLCMFPFSISVQPRNYENLPDTFCKLLYTATGINMDEAEILRVGERVYNVEKAFNTRLGFRAQDDTWAQAKHHTDFTYVQKYYQDRQDVLKEYYQDRGWNIESGLQKRKKLEELALEDIAEELFKGGADEEN